MKNRKLTEHQISKIKELFNSNKFSKTEIGKILNISRDLVKYYTRTPKQIEMGRERSRKTYYKNPNKSKENSARWKKLNPIKAALSVAKARAKKLGLPFNLQEKDYTVKSVCPVFKTEIEFGIPRDLYRSASFDRVLPELGYTKENVRVISLKANTLKCDATLEQLEMLVKYIKENK